VQRIDRILKWEDAELHRTQARRARREFERQAIDRRASSRRQFDDRLRFSIALERKIPVAHALQREIRRVGVTGRRQEGEDTAAFDSSRTA